MFSEGRRSLHHAIVRVLYNSGLALHRVLGKVG